LVTFLRFLKLNFGAATLYLCVRSSAANYKPKRLCAETTLSPSAYYLIALREGSSAIGLEIDGSFLVFLLS
jgi:hypothetical protein